MKYIILIMLCNQDLFLDEYDLIQETWAKNHKENIYGYIGDLSIAEPYIDDKHLIHIPYEDDLNHTFGKTWYAIKYIKEKFNPDFIFRTNTSSVANIQLLEKIISELNPTTEILYGSEFYRLENLQILTLKKFNLKPCKYFEEGILYLRGNSLILSKTVYNILLNNSKPDDGTCDDYSIGCILKKYHSSKNRNYIDYINVFPQAWYKSFEIKSKYYYAGNGLCSWGNTNISYDFLKYFLIVQIKSYTNLDKFKRLEYIKLISNVFNSNKDNNINDTYNKLIKYQNKYMFIYNNWDKLYTYFIKKNK